MALGRRFLSALLAALAACTLAASAPQPAGGREKHLVTGVTWRDGRGNVPLRREIRDLQHAFPEQWNLYLLGLRALQLADPDSPVSYNRIAGIHARPFQVWEDAIGLPGSSGTGYCPHSHPLFAGWHRPYVALFEQELYKHVRAVALTAPADELARYGDAADSFRVPYWDWALGEKGGSVPECFTSPTVNVTPPGQKARIIPNPLFQYNFGSSNPAIDDGKWSAYNHTMRYATTDTSDAVSQNDQFVEGFENMRRSVLDKVAILYSTKTKSFSHFAQQLEAIHGWVHVVIGGSGNGPDTYAGHMWPTSYSAFDPLFMLHHANVDRFLALWQAANPSLWQEPTKTDKPIKTIPANVMVDANTPLAPFWKDQSTFWTLNMAYDTTMLGYAYPETQYWNYATTAEYRSAVNATIARLYSPSARSMLADSHFGATGMDLTRLARDGTFVDWNIIARVETLEVPESFQVVFSIVGDFSSDKVTEVGVWAQLKGANMDAKGSETEEKRQSGPDTKLQSPRQRSFKRSDTSATDSRPVRGLLPLTSPLLDHIADGKLASLQPEDVVPYLQNKLTWSVLLGDDGVRVAPSSIRSLSVELESWTAHIPDDSDAQLEYPGEPVVYKMNGDE